jgi:flavin-dependent dehydrogenase
LPGETADDFHSLDALKPLISPWTSRVHHDELELIRVTEYTFRAQIADRWRRGNIFLLGDAAHLTPPFIGQGMGAGLRDAMNLVWKLAGAIAGDLPATVLDSYEQERKPHTRQMIRLARLVDDRRRAFRQSNAAPSRHAHALRPFDAKQDSGQPNTGPAPLAARSSVSQTATAGRDSMPQPRVFGRTSRRRPRWRLRIDHRSAAERHAAHPAR